MSKGSAPSAPDPYASAGAQYQYGTAAANYNKGLNATNVVTPYGATSWSESPAGVPQTGATPTTGASGGAPQSISIPGYGDITLPQGYGGYGGTPGTGAVPPQYTETQSLSPGEQNLFNLAQGGQTAIAGETTANLASPQSGYQESVAGAQDIPGFTREAQNAAFQQQAQYLDPQFQQEGEQLDAQLRNSGAQPGDPAYDNAMKLFTNQEQQGYTNAFDNAVGAGLNEQQGLFGEELGGAQFQDQALINGLSQTGFGTPSFGLGSGGSGTGGGGGVSAPDIMGAFNNQYAGQLAGYNANVSSSNADLGALASIAAAFIMA